MLLKQLAQIRTKSIFIMTKDKRTIVGRIASHQTSEDFSKITLIHVLPEKGFPVLIDTENIKYLEVIEDETIYLNFEEV